MNISNPGRKMPDKNLQSSSGVYRSYLNSCEQGPAHAQRIRLIYHFE
jgi:hypothetical protein